MSRPAQRRRLTILGGSSPFTAALVDAMATETPVLPAFDLVLHGRTAELLQRMQRYAEHRLGPLGYAVEATTRLEPALAGAGIVIHQNRYGGLQGRADDEQVALAHEIPPDETLGPAALNSLLRMLPGLRQMGETIARASPDAWVLNLTNPLSAATSVLSLAGVRSVIGLCELPLITVRRAAALLDLPSEQLEWSYVGLNHRGFVVRLELDGEDCIERLADRLGHDPFEGVPASEIRRLRSIPTKYFALLAGNAAPRGGRAAALNELRSSIAEELACHPDRSPPGLNQRYMEWYPSSVVPMIAALTSDRPRCEVVNHPCLDGVTREQRAWVCCSGIDTVEPPCVSGPVGAYLARFELHEQAIIDVIDDPSLETVRHALHRDPLVPADRADAVAGSIWGRHRSRYGGTQ